MIDPEFWNDRFHSCALAAGFLAAAEGRLAESEYVRLLAYDLYESGAFRLSAGDRLVLVTDGVTEAENCGGEFFDNHRLDEIAARSTSMEDIFGAIADFCGATALSDDCTVVDLLYTGPDGNPTEGYPAR